MNNRVQRFFLSVTSSYLRLIVQISVFFFLTPLIIRMLGQENYGLWTMLTAVVSLFGLLEFGFGTATMRFVAGARTDDARLREIASTLMVLHVLLTILATAGIGLLSLFLGPVLGLSEEQVVVGRQLLWLFGLRLVILYLPGSFFRNILFGLQKIALINGIQIGTTLLYGLAAAFLIPRGLSMVQLAALYLATVSVELTLYALFSLGRFRARFSLRLVRMSVLREIASFSFFAFVTQIAGLVLLRTDPIIVQYFMPLSAVAVYGVALRLGQYLFLLLKQSTNVFAPAIAEFHAEREEVKIRFLLVNGTRFAMAPAGLALVGVLLFGRTAIVLWVGASFAEAANVLNIIVGASFLLVPQMVAAAVLAMTGHHRVSGTLALVSTVANIAVSLLLVRPLGLVGVALGTLTAVVVVDFGILVAWTCRIHELRYLRWLWRVIPASLVPGMLAMATGLLVRHLMTPESWPSVLLAAVPVIITYLLVFWFFFVEASEKELIRSRLFGQRGRTRPPSET